MKHAEIKILSICVDAYKIYEGNDYDKKSEALSTLKNRKEKIKNVLIEKYKDMLENPAFGQDHWSGTTEGIFKNGHDSIRIMKWLIDYDRFYYDNMNYFDLMGSVFKKIFEISCW